MSQLPNIWSLIEDHLKCSIPLVNSMTSSLLEKKGKAIRSQLTLSLAQSLDKPLSSQQEQDLSLCCAIIEMIHSGTLVHDDVIDTSKTRRGQLASHEIFGNTCSVLLGDYLFTKAFSCAFLLSSSQEFLYELSLATNQLVEGELLQIEYNRSQSTCWDTYEKIILYKTAILFKLSSLSVALFCDNQNAKNYQKLGTLIGLFFQKVDDYLDYFSTLQVLGKAPGGDFNERKMTYPVLVSGKNNPEIFKAFFDKKMDFSSFKKLLSKNLNNIHKDLKSCYKELYQISEIHYSKKQANVIKNLLNKIFDRTNITEKLK